MKKQFVILLFLFLFNISSQPILVNSSNQLGAEEMNFVDMRSPEQLESNYFIFSSGFPLTIKDVCQLIYSKVIGIPGIFIEKIEGSFFDDYLNKYIQGCLFLISGTWSQLGENPSPIDQISNLLTEEGWTQNYEYSADGPDGTTFSLRKGDDCCIVHGRWDGGDDSDTTYIPLDNYQVIVLVGKLSVK